MNLRQEFTNAPVAAFLWATLFVILLSYVGPAIDDHSEESGAAKDAIAQQRQQVRIERLARFVCGDNAGYQIEGNTLQCFNHRGKKTVTAEVGE